jgi:hypothetical protein
VQKLNNEHGRTQEIKVDFLTRIYLEKIRKGMKDLKKITQPRFKLRTSQIQFGSVTVQANFLVKHTTVCRFKYKIMQFTNYSFIPHKEGTFTVH